MAEAQLQKLKVTELKELLHKHELPQTGKKDELVKRLLENNIAPDSAEEELVDPDADTAAPPAETTTSAAPAPSAQQPASNSEAAPATEATETAQTLTPEQQAMKARAERFGIPFNPNATPSSRTKPATSAPTPAPAAATAAATPAAPKKEKAGAIDKAPLGISDEVLAKRAAKFGLPEKKESQAPAAAPTPAAKPTSAAAPAAKPEAELTPEMKEKLAADEEKKRKRAEKFGTAKPANGVETEGTDAKKAKV